MQHTESQDGTPIAFERIGSGTPVVIVGGAMSTADAGRPLAAALADVGLQGVVLDRRARGGSGDTLPYAPVREAEDVAAVVRAVGGRAAVLGHSSGAVLALLAASTGVPVVHLFLSEPPFRFGAEPVPADLPARLGALVDAGDEADAISLFQREGVGLPEAVVAQIRASPMFADLVPLARSTVYDATLAEDLETPTAAMRAVAVPVTVLRGEPTFPLLVRAALRLAEAMPQAELVVVPESHDHGIDPEATARLVRSRVA